MIKFATFLNIKKMETSKINPVQPKRGTLQRMARAFDRSTASISQHLSGITNNDLSQRIRKMALELGGRETK
jgi:hypothetical protein